MNRASHGVVMKLCLRYVLIGVFPLFFYLVPCVMWEYILKLHGLVRVGISERMCGCIWVEGYL